MSAGEQAVPEITVTLSGTVSAFTLGEQVAAGTYIAASATAANIGAVKVLFLQGGVSGQKVTAVLLNNGRVLKVLASAAVTSCVAPLKCAGSGAVSPAGAGGQIGYPLGLCGAGEYVNLYVDKHVVS